MGSFFIGLVDVHSLGTGVAVSYTVLDVVHVSWLVQLMKCVHEVSDVSCCYHFVVVISVDQCGDTESYRSCM
jgi:hypothetical protein